MNRAKRSKQRLEYFAILLWHAVQQSAKHGGPEAERARLVEAADAMHACRMVLDGAAAEMASTLCDLAWARITRLDREHPQPRLDSEGLRHAA